MKTLKYFIILFSLTLAFTSCNNDDDIPPYPFTQDNLIGIYQLEYLKSKKVETTMINSFEVKTTTQSEADTFSMTYEFNSNDTLTLNGTYRITQIKKLGGQTSDSSYIKVFDQEKKPYIIYPEQRELSIDGTRYQVKDYSSTEFTLLHQTKTLDDNGNEVIFKKEIHLSK